MSRWQSSDKSWEEVGDKEPFLDQTLGSPKPSSPLGLSLACENGKLSAQTISSTHPLPHVKLKPVLV